MQYSDWLGVYTKLKTQPNRSMEKIPTPEMAFESVWPDAVEAAT